MTHRWLSVSAATALAAVLTALGPSPERPPAAAAAVIADSLTPTERRIASAVDERNAQALALLERVVNINSGTMNLAGVRRVGDAFRAELDALGFTTRSASRRAGWTAPASIAPAISSPSGRGVARDSCSSVTSIRCSSRGARSRNSSG
jgi:hypothetical protein